MADPTAAMNKKIAERWEAALSKSRVPVMCPRCGMVGETNEDYLTVEEALALHQSGACKNPPRRGFLRRLLGGRRG